MSVCRAAGRGIEGWRKKMDVIERIILLVVELNQKVSSQGVQVFESRIKRSNGASKIAFTEVALRVYLSRWFMEIISLLKTKFRFYD